MSFNGFVRFVVRYRMENIPKLWTRWLRRQGQKAYEDPDNAHISEQVYVQLAKLPMESVVSSKDMRFRVLDTTFALSLKATPQPYNEHRKHTPARTVKSVKKMADVSSHVYRELMRRFLHEEFLDKFILQFSDLDEDELVERCEGGARIRSCTPAEIPKWLNLFSETKESFKTWSAEKGEVPYSSRAFDEGKTAGAELTVGPEFSVLRVDIRCGQNLAR